MTMGCACKDMAREIADYRKQIHDLRNCFIKRMSVDSETNDRRRKDYNQAIFFDDGSGEHPQSFNYMTMEMVLDCFDNAVKDWRRGFCDVENCGRY